MISLCIISGRLLNKDILHNTHTDTRNLIFSFSGTNADTQREYRSKEVDLTKRALSDPVLFSSMRSTQAVLMWFEAVSVGRGATARGSGSSKGK